MNLTCGGGGGHRRARAFLLRACAPYLPAYARARVNVRKFGSIIDDTYRFEFGSSRDAYVARQRKAIATHLCSVTTSSRGSYRANMPPLLESNYDTASEDGAPLDIGPEIQAYLEAPCKFRWTRNGEWSRHQGRRWRLRQLF